MTRARETRKALDPQLTDAHVDRIQVLRPVLPNTDRLLSYLRRIDGARTYTNWGPLASELESRLGVHFHLPDRCVTSASSGTAALVGAILATAGRASAKRARVIIPAFTFVATPLAAEQCGFGPHLVDVDFDSWQLRADTLSEHPLLPETGLVIPVAAFGRAVPQAPWLDFRRRTGVEVVIDGGASFEAISADPSLYLGEIPVALSFHATKSFATAEGGCVITTDPRLSMQVGQALNFGFFATRDCRSASTNGKMSEYHAAVGLAELDGWPLKRANLQAVASRYRQELAKLGLGGRLTVAPDVAGCYVLFRCADETEAAEILRSLAKSGVGFRHWYGYGLHRQPYFADVSRDALPETDRIAPMTVGLPTAPDLSPSDISRVIAAVVSGIK